MVSRVVTFSLLAFLGIVEKGNVLIGVTSPWGRSLSHSYPLSEDCTQIILSSKPWDPSPHPGLPKCLLPSAIHPGEGAPTLLSVVAGPGDTVFIHHSRAGCFSPQALQDKEPLEGRLT